MVSVEEDIQQIKSYIYIQKIRYEERLQVIFDLDPDSLQLKINKLLIQPIVENAIVHGIENTGNGGMIRISSKIAGDFLIIEVFDNGAGFSDNTMTFLSPVYQEFDNEAPHMGIRNVHHRLKLYYGEEHGIEIDSKLGAYTSVILKFPIIKGAEL
jgi:sensor histidine kinase YesM